MVVSCLRPSWNAPDKVEAIEQYQAWRQLIPPDIEPIFMPIITMMNNWHEEIFNYFDMPITNAFTEAANSVIRHADRQGRGYSFDVLRTKVLLKSLHSEQKPKFDKHVFGHALTSLFDDFYGPNSYGIDLATFIQVMENSDL